MAAAGSEHVRSKNCPDLGAPPAGAHPMDSLWTPIDSPVGLPKPKEKSAPYERPTWTLHAVQYSADTGLCTQRIYTRTQYLSKIAYLRDQYPTCCWAPLPSSGCSPEAAKLRIWLQPDIMVREFFMMLILFSSWRLGIQLRLPVHAFQCRTAGVLARTRIIF